MESIKEKAINSRILRVFLALVLAVSMIGAIFPAQIASAAPTYNEGNPYENGDLTWDQNKHAYKLTGTTIRVGGVTQIGTGAPPFPYPSFLTEANAAGDGNYPGWGISNFSYSSVTVTKNNRNLAFSNPLPTTGHCAQSNNETCNDLPRDAYLYVLPEESYWSADGGTYYATLIMMVDNGHEHGVWDQATIGLSKMTAEWRVKGNLDLQKVSNNTDITNNNSCYSLKDAQYGIYTEAACTNQVGTLTTNASGYAKSADLNVGAYYVKETIAPKGYAKDNTVYSVQVVAGQTMRVNGTTVSDMPQGDPARMWVGKIDLETTLNMPQGSASLAGAEFTVKYYGGYYSTTNKDWIDNTAPTRTWVVKTDEDGFAALDKNYLVSGDSFYYASNGHITIPLGTVTIQETKAPEGYLLSDDTVYVQQVTTEGYLESVETYDAPIVSEQVVRGGLSLTKFINETENYEEQTEIKTPVADVDFEIVNQNDSAVTRTDGTVIEPGQVVMTITTNKNGYAATEANDLVYGTYLVREVASTTPDSYDPIQPFTVTVSEDGEMYRYIVEDKLTLSPVKVIKVDSETGKQIPAFVTYQLLDADKNVITFTTHYTETIVHETFTAAKDGTLTFPERLKKGTYYLREVTAPEGYVLSDELLSFDVTETNNWDNPMIVEFENTPIKGEITIVKADALTGDAVAGAEYTVRAVGDIVTGDGTVRFVDDEIVASGLLTDANGSVAIEGLYLGLYKVYETKSPEGYALDTNEYFVEILSQRQDVPVVKMRQDVVDIPTTVKVVKTDVTGGDPLAGASFRIWQDGADPKDAFDTNSVLLELLGGMQALNDDIVNVDYNNAEAVLNAFQEATAGDEVEFRVSAKMADDFISTHTLIATFNDDFTITITMNDDTEVCVIAAKEIVVEGAFDFTGTTDENGELSVPYLKHGTYNIIEVAAPEGYFLPNNLVAQAFTVDDQGLIDGKAVYVVEQTNDFTKLDISKQAITTSEEIEGATLTITDKDGNVVDEWVSTTEPHRIENIEPGIYTLTETMAPATYEYAQSITFAVFATGDVQTVVMYDEPIKISGEIDKRQTIAAGGESYQYTIDYRSTSSTWADELNVIDPLECVNEGLTRVKEIQTPVSFEDYDGMMYVFYQTNKGGNTNDVNPLANNPYNAWNEKNESMQDWSDWSLWAEVSTLKSSTLKVADLKLADDEYITAIGFAHGRVEKSFTTRLGEWDRDNLKSEHDNLDSVVTPHADAFDLMAATGLTKTEKSTSVNYAPAVLTMDIISEDYYSGTADLWNSAEMNIWRNKGLVPELLYDDDADKVVQSYTPETPETGKYDKTGDLERLAPYLIVLALCLLAAGASTFYLVRRKRKSIVDVKEIPEKTLDE